MDWTGETLIRAPKKPAPVRRDTPQSALAWKRVPDSDYIAASVTGMSKAEAAAWIGVSLVAVWKAAKRLGLAFRDGRKNG